MPWYHPGFFSLASILWYFSVYSLVTSCFTCHHYISCNSCGKKNLRRGILPAAWGIGMWGQVIQYRSWGCRGTICLSWRVLLGVATVAVSTLRHLPVSWVVCLCSMYVTNKSIQCRDYGILIPLSGKHALRHIDPIHERRLKSMTLCWILRVVQN